LARFGARSLRSNRHRPHHFVSIDYSFQVLVETSSAASSRMSQIREKLTVDVISAINEQLQVPGDVGETQHKTPYIFIQIFDELEVLHEKRRRLVFR
jgi:hypothetical protein